MGIFFAKKKVSSRITEQDKAVLQLKQTRDTLKQYQRKLERSVENEKTLIKQLVQNGQKERALLLLRKKKFQEHLLSQTDNQLENLERMVYDLEFAEIQTTVISGLKVGNTALKKLHDLMSIDDIEKVMDETREGIEKQQEINEILTGELTTEDEDEVEAEFNELLKADETTIPTEEISLPDIPQEEPERRKVEEKRKVQKAVPLEA